MSDIPSPSDETLDGIVRDALLSDETSQSALRRSSLYRVLRMWLDGAGLPVAPDVTTTFRALNQRLDADGSTAGSGVAFDIERVDRGLKHHREAHENFGRRWTRDLGTQTLRAGLWIGTSVAVIGVMVVLLTSRVGPIRQDVVHRYVTGPYQQGIINLGDGTRVTLAPQTTLRVLRFGTQERTVALENGEAYFEVAQASGAPFIVQSGTATAQVLGTAFLVRHNANDQHVHVAVTDGKVRVTTPARPDKSVTLTVGQVGDVTDSVTHVSAVDDVTPGTERAPGRIIFRYTPLATVLQTVSQWYGFHFRYTDQTLGARTVTIMISTQSSADALAAIEQVLAVNLTVVGDTVTLAPQPPRSSRSAPRIRTYDVWTPIREVGR